MSSFRDPSGYLFTHSEKIFRGVFENHASPFLEFMSSPLFKELRHENKIPHTQVIDSPPICPSSLAEKKGTLFLEHQKIPFPSYPYEWSPQMLYQAGEFTLELLVQSLKHDYILKDATPYNILFSHCQPVFVDLLSFEKYNGTSTWGAYNQFCQTFFLPLLVYKFNKHLPSSLFYTKRDGMSAEEAVRNLKGWRRLVPQVFFYALLPHWFSATAERKKINPATIPLDSLKKAKFTLNFLIERLRKSFIKLKPPMEKSTWSNYMTSHACSYSSKNFDVKEQTITKILKTLQPNNVLDIGCNTGHFSKIAAQWGGQVVAIDFDGQVVGKLFSEASKEKLPILPLQIDFSRPSPAMGWNNQETSSFLERSKNHFDLVLMLAVLHHLIVQERIPLGEVLKLVHRLTKNYLLIEYVGKEDPMFQKIARGRESLHQNYSERSFEEALTGLFEIIEKHPIPQSFRCLYLLKKCS